MSRAEVEIPKATIAVIALIFGAVFLMCAFLSYQILYTLEWVTWAGVILCLGVFGVGLTLLTVGWIWLRVLRG